MATSEEYAKWIIDNQQKKGTPEFETVAAAYQDLRSKAQPTPERSLFDQLKTATGNTAAGLLRGAGSIGATILSPVDMLTDVVMGDRKGKPSRNEQRRADIDAGLQAMGADPESAAYQAGKIGSEIAGTAGAGGLIAKTPMIARLAPEAVAAVRGSGFAPGATFGQKVGAGALTGAAQSGMTDPSQVGTGAVVGGALPGIGSIVRQVAKAARGPEQTKAIADAVQKAREAGYVIPPTQARSNIANRMLEGLSGKITTAQNASVKNQEVTNKLAASALGLPTDIQITPDVLSSVRRAAGAAYSDLGSIGVITPNKSYSTALDKIAEPFLITAKSFPNAKPSPVLDVVDSLRASSFDAGAAIEKIKQLRTASDDAFRTGNTDIGRASKSAAKALEDAIEDHLSTSGNQQLLDKFRQGRQLIAKTYSVEKALNPATGSIDAKKLAAELKRNKPLTNELKQIAEFSGAFPKATQTVESMGSLPQVSPLDWFAGGSISAATMNPVGMVAVGARPAARAIALSPFIQNRLIQPAATKPNNALMQMLYKSAPIVGAQQTNNRGQNK